MAYQAQALPGRPCRLCGRPYAPRHIHSQSCGPDCRRLESALKIWLKAQPRGTRDERRLAFSRLLKRSRQLMKGAA